MGRSFFKGKSEAERGVVSVCCGAAYELEAYIQGGATSATGVDIKSEFARAEFGLTRAANLLKSDQVLSLQGASVVNERGVMTQGYDHDLLRISAGDSLFHCNPPCGSKNRAAAQGFYRTTLLYAGWPGCGGIFVVSRWSEKELQEAARQMGVEVYRDSSFQITGGALGGVFSGHGNDHNTNQMHIYVTSTVRKAVSASELVLAPLMMM